MTTLVYFSLSSADCNIQLLLLAKVSNESFIIQDIIYIGLPKYFSVAEKETSFL